METAPGYYDIHIMLPLQLKNRVILIHVEFMFESASDRGARCECARADYGIYTVGNITIT
jgi:hypothetical protein